MEPRTYRVTYRKIDRWEDFKEKLKPPALCFVSTYDKNYIPQIIKRNIKSDIILYTAHIVKDDMIGGYPVYK